MKKHPAYWFNVFAAIILGIAGCGNTGDTLPEVVIDRSECAKCRMLISDARFVGMIKTSEYLMFDDIGCMLRYDKTATAAKNGIWVRDYFTNTWLNANDAAFFRLNDVETPMGFGYLSTAAKTVPAAATIRMATVDALRSDFSTRFTSKAK